MKKILVSTGLLILMGTSCASEESWIKRRDAIRQHAAEQHQNAPTENQNATEGSKADNNTGAALSNAQSKVPQG